VYGKTIIIPLQESQAVKLYDRFQMQDGYCQDFREMKIDKIEIECLKVYSISVEGILDRMSKDHHES